MLTYADTHTHTTACHQYSAPAGDWLFNTRQLNGGNELAGVNTDGWFGASTTPPTCVETAAAPAAAGAAPAPA